MPQPQSATFARVASLVAAIVRVDPRLIAMTSGVGTVGNWDSLCQLSVLAALEQEFSIQIEPDEAVELTTVGRICEFIDRGSAS
jgi:acyl carrier protein